MVTYVNKIKVGRYAGLSTEEKPLDVQNGSVLFEIDTGLYYMYDAENKTWYLQEDNGSGGEGGTRDHTKLVNRDKPKQHPIEAIDGLVEALSWKE